MDLEYVQFLSLQYTFSINLRLSTFFKFYKQIHFNEARLFKRLWGRCEEKFEFQFQHIENEFCFYLVELSVGNVVATVANVGKFLSDCDADVRN